MVLFIRLTCSTVGLYHRCNFLVPQTCFWTATRNSCCCTFGGKLDFVNNFDETPALSHPRCPYHYRRLCLAGSALDCVSEGMSCCWLRRVRWVAKDVDCLKEFFLSLTFFFSF